MMHAEYEKQARIHTNNHPLALPCEFWVSERLLLLSFLSAVWMTWPAHQRVICYVCIQRPSPPQAM